MESVESNGVNAAKIVNLDDRLQEKVQSIVVARFAASNQEYVDPARVSFII